MTQWLLEPNKSEVRLEDESRNISALVSQLIMQPPYVVSHAFTAMAKQLRQTFHRLWQAKLEIGQTTMSDIEPIVPKWIVLERRMSYDVEFLNTGTLHSRVRCQ